MFANVIDNIIALLAQRKAERECDERKKKCFLLIRFIFILFVFSIPFWLDAYTRCGYDCDTCKNISNGYWDLNTWTADCVKCTAKNYYLSEDSKKCV